MGILGSRKGVNVALLYNEPQLGAIRPSVI